MNISALLDTCSIIIAPSLASAIIHVESSNNPHAINVNATNFVKEEMATMEEAIRYSKNLISLGFSIDLGLAQINSNNLPALNISVDEIFDPCTNLQAMQKVFLWGYDMNSDKGMTAAEKRIAAISRYNTGHKNKGVQNGYVRKVLDATNLVDENEVKAEEAQVVITLESEEEATSYVQDGFSQTRNIN